MDLIKQGVITLLKSAITGENYLLPEKFDLETAYPMLKKHHMDTLLYEGAVRCGISLDLPVMKQLFQRYCRQLLVSEGQQRQVGRIFAAFEENGIDYLPLKGCRMKYLYPKPELRYMGDADILIHLEQYHKVAPVMKSLGFTETEETDLELCWQHPELRVELHKQMSPLSHEDLCEFFGDGWKFAVAHKGHYWTMTTEDEWIFLFAHFAKHFRTAGIGCRYVVDLWVFLRSHKDMDGEYIRAEMKKLQLWDFYENIRRLIAVWFENSEPDDKTVFITDYIFSCGSWGNLENLVLSQSVRGDNASTGTRGRIGYLWRTAFPRRELLEGQYRVLKKAPWLLPIVWMYRLVNKLICERGKIQIAKKSIDTLTTENLNARRQMLNYVGLNPRN